MVTDRRMITSVSEYSDSCDWLQAVKETRHTRLQPTDNESVVDDAQLLPVSLEPVPAIDVYKRDVDRTLIRVNLKLTTDERVRKRISALRFAKEVRRSRTPTLIQLKRAAGCPKDLERIADT